MGGLRDGRKSILFFSQGPGVRPGSPNDHLMREIDEAANRGNVTIHVIDPRPLGSVGFGGDTMLRRLAADTGGRAILNTNNPMEQLTGVMADASAYYLVGYTPTRRGNDGKFHEIKVRVKRRGVQRHRAPWLLVGEREGDDRGRRSRGHAGERRADHGACRRLSDSVNTRAVSIWTGFAKADADAHARDVHLGAERRLRQRTSRRGSRFNRSTKPARRRCRRR